MEQQVKCNLDKVYSLWELAFNRKQKGLPNYNYHYVKRSLEPLIAEGVIIIVSLGFLCCHQLACDCLKSQSTNMKAPVSYILSLK